MATASQVAKASLNRRFVRDAIAPLSATDIEDFIFEMNNFMLGLDGQGIVLGYTIIENASDEVTIPTTTLRGLITNMAIEVAPAYDAVVTPELAQIANEGMKQMVLIGQNIGEMRFPETLPIGSGNEYDTGNLLISHFYLDEEAEILAESTGSISLERNTNTVINNE